MSQHRILRLRGLPWSADETDIREFLHAQDVKEVYICKRGELSTGEAYIEFSSSEEASSTQVACNREVLGGRYIEIFLSEAESMDEVKERLREQDSGWVVRLRGLPFKATQEDVVMFFKGIEVLRGAHGVTLIYGRDGRPLGEAYVELPDEESQTKALHLDRERMGARYIEVFKSTKADLNVRLQSARKNEGQRRQSWTGSSGLPMERHIGMQGLAPGMMVLPYGTVPSLGVPHSPSAALRLHGLPADSTVGEVAAFFSDFGVPPASVQIAPDQSQDGVMLGTSIAHVSFTSPELADIARQQSQQRLFKDRYLEVYPILGPSGISGLSGYQAQALPVSPSGMWSAPPVRYMYDDLSKLLAPKPGRPMYQPLSPAAQPALPLANPGIGYLGNSQLLPGQNPFGPQTPGSPGINRMQPTSPGGLSAMGQRGVFSPRPIPLPPGMAPASPLSMNQQAVGWSAQQQQQVFLLRQQQQQFLLQQQQNARMQPGPSWNLPGPRLTGPTQFGTQPRVPVQSHLQAFVPRPDEPQASIAVQQPDDTITRPLLPASSPENEATALPEETIRSNFPPFDRLQAVTRSRLSEPEGPASQHSSRPQASSSNLSERQSDTLAQNLSLTSLHLSDRALSGRSPAASTTNSAPSPSTGMRRAASNPFGSQNSPDVGF